MQGRCGSPKDDGVEGVEDGGVGGGLCGCSGGGRCGWRVDSRLCDSN